MKLPAKNIRSGFTLIELLVVIAIIAVISTVLVIAINPMEMLARSRDSSRLTDIDNMDHAIKTALEELNGPPAALLCFNLTPPCQGISNTGAGARITDGTGWIRINFNALDSAKFSTLPIDPINGPNFYYRYKSDGTSYELNAILESQQHKSKMNEDGGDNNNTYEKGTYLRLLN